MSAPLSLPLRHLIALAAAVGLLTSTAVRAAEPAPAADAATTAAAPTPPAPMSWRSFVTEVERRNPLMRAARAGLDVFEAKLGQADWAYFPSIKLDAGVVPFPEITDDDDGNTDLNWSKWGVFYQVKLSLVQPIWTFGKIAALQRAAAHGQRVGQAQVEIARWELRYRAAEAYYGRLLAGELDVIVSDGEDWLSKAEERLERLRDEDSPEYDQSEHLRLKTRVADFHVLAAQNAELMAVSSAGIRLLLDRQDGAVPALEETELRPIEVALAPVEHYVALLRDNSPELRMARAGRDARAALAERRDAELWPDIVFIAEMRFEDNTLDEDLTVATDILADLPVTGLVGLRWNLDVPIRLERANEAWAEANKTKYEAEAAGLLSELKVRRLYQQLAGKQKLVEVFRRSQKSAQGWLTANWDLYDAGFGNFRDVMDALVQFYSKKAGYLQQVHEHNLLIYKLSQVVGVDLTEVPVEAGD